MSAPSIKNRAINATTVFAFPPQHRYYARKIVLSLMQHEDFGRLIEKHVPQRDLKSFQEVVVHLRTKVRFILDYHHGYSAVANPAKLSYILTTEVGKSCDTLNLSNTSIQFLLCC